MGLLGAAWEMPQCLWGRSHSTSLNFRTAEVVPWHSLLNRAGGEDGQSDCQYEGNSIGFHLCNKMPGENSLLGLRVRLQSTGA